LLQASPHILLFKCVPNFGEGQPVPEPISPHRQENHNLDPMCNKEHP